MEAKPMLIIQGSRPVSHQKAQRAVAKFLAVAESIQTSNAISKLPDDVMNKLAVLAAELNSTIVNYGGVEDSEIMPTSSKKRKSDLQPSSEEKKSKKEKKDKKDKDKKQMVESISPVEPAKKPVTKGEKDEKLMKMKQSLKLKAKG